MTATPAPLRVATWNLWWRFGDWRRRQEVVTASLAAALPDLVGPQEVWTRDGEDQASSLGEALGMHAVVAPSPAPQRWQRRPGDPATGFANAVLSRWPVLEHDVHVHVHVLPAAPGEAAERTLLRTAVDAPGGPVPFATTQLDSAPHGCSAGT